MRRRIPNPRTAFVAFRCTPALREQILSAAEQSQRTVSAEIMFRLMKSFAEEKEKTDEC
jgi:hypothetical protein